MQPAVLTRQQVVVHGLADQLVPEGVAVALGAQHVGGHRRAQRPDQRAVVQAGHGGQQRVPGHRTARAGDAQHLLGVLRQSAHAVEQQIAQGFRQL